MSAPVALLFALLAPVLGALGSHWTRLRPKTRELSHGFFLIFFGGLVVLFLLGEEVRNLGLAALLLFFAGAITPLVLARGLSKKSLANHATSALAISGLLMHTILDGAALASSTLDREFVLAVLIHRLPVGAAVWWIVRARVGRKAALFSMGLLVVFTCLGHWIGNELLEVRALVGLQVFVIGSLVHVLVHPGEAHPGTRHPHLPKWQFAGGALGVLLLISSFRHDNAPYILVSAFLARFFHLAGEAAPALLLGYLAAGLVTHLVPTAPLSWLRGKNSLSQALRGTAFGAPLPICSCGVVPVYEGLFSRGVPSAAGIAFLIATPELGIETVLLSFPLLGAEFTGLRLVSALLLAIVVGCVASFWVDPSALRAETEERFVARSFLVRLKAAAKFGFGELVDHTLPWILLGIAVAAFFEPGMITLLVSKLPEGTDVLLAVALGVPIYVCASGATPLAAAFLVAGASPGAALAFLLAGPATNITTFGVLSRLHGKKMAAVVVVATSMTAIGLGLMTNFLFSASGVEIAERHLHAPVIGGITKVALLGVLGLMLSSLLRQGLSGFLANIFEAPGSEHAHAPDHGHQEHTQSCHHHSHAH